MDQRRLHPLSGIAFVAIVALALALGGTTPSSDASGAEVVSFYSEQQWRQFAAAFVLAASVPFLVLFGTNIAAAFASRERRSPWELVLVGGTVLAGGIILLVSFVQLTLVDGAEQGIAESALQAANALVGNMWIAWNAAFGVTMLGAAGLFLSAPGRVRRLGWAALVLGIALFVPFADFVALLITPIWIVVTSVVLARGPLTDRFTVTPTTA